MEKKKASNIASILFPICIFLSVYNMPGTRNTPLGVIILSIVAIFVLLSNQGKIAGIQKEEKILIFFMLYIILNQTLVLFFFPNIQIGTNFKLLLMNTFAIMVILIMPRYIDYKIIYKTYKILGLFSCIGIVVQSYQVYVKKELTQMIVIPFMKPLLSESTRQYIIYNYARMRPSSFFTEPSMFCTFIAPLVIFELKNRKYRSAALISVCMLLTTSTTGVFLTIAIWCYYAFFLLKKNTAKFLLLLCFVIACIAIFNSSLFSFTVSKLLRTNLLTNERSASAITIFTQMPIMDKITGIGAGNVSAYLSHSSINMSTVEVTVQGYVSSAFGNFIMYGVAGGIFFFIICGIMILRAHKWTRVFGMLILALSFIQTISFNTCGIEWFVLYQLMKQTEEDEQMVSDYEKSVSY